MVERVSYAFQYVGDTLQEALRKESSKTEALRTDMNSVLRSPDPGRARSGPARGKHRVRRNKAESRVIKPRSVSAYLTVITNPLRSALTIAPTELPVSVSTAPLGLVSTMACAPRPTAAPTLPAA